MLKYAKKIITIIIAISLIGILPVLSQGTYGIIIFEKEYFFLKTKAENTEYFFTEEFKKYLSESDETKHLVNLIKDTELLYDGREPTAILDESSFKVNLTEERTDLPEMLKLINKLDKIVSANIFREELLDYIPGDVDGDTRIESSDARLCLRAVVGLEELTLPHLILADVDGNGIVEVSDAREILRRSVGLYPNRK